MPIYEYRCRECGDFEVLLGMGAATRESDCPGCGSAARRLMSAPGLSRPSMTSNTLGTSASSSESQLAQSARMATGQSL